MSQKIFVLIPAMNESLNIYDVVDELRSLRLGNSRLIHQVIVCDNGSSDNTAELAARAGALVVSQAQRGYGVACLTAMRELRNQGAEIDDIVIFVDGDHSVVAEEVFDLLDSLNTNQGLVIGARGTRGLERGAMSPQQRVGNHVASALIRFLWQIKVTDLGPFRALHYGDLLQLHMQDEAFGWTVEMQVKAIQQELPYSEVAVSTRRRRGRSKISGTLLGTIGAAHGIFSTIFWLWWQQRSTTYSLDHRDNHF